jgi:probable F420-dependent oxidoreductase
MTKTLLPHGSLGINVAIREDGAHLPDAVELEGLGYDAVWIAGGQLDRLGRVRDLVRATERIRVATGIVPLGVRATDEIAGLYADLERDAPGRLVLGLGGPQQARPLAALDRYLSELDALGVAPAGRLLAALGPRKTEVARLRSAGAITLLVTPESTARSRALLGPGPLLVVQQMLVLTTDADAARAAGRVPLGFLAGVPGYRSAFLRMGFDDRDVDELSDRLVDAVVVHGDEADVVRRVAAQRAAGADHVALSVLTPGPSPTPMEVAHRLAAVLVGADAGSHLRTGRETPVAAGSAGARTIRGRR